MDTRTRREPAAPATGDAPLVYVDDTQSGYRRVRVNGHTFHYLDAQGKRISDETEIQRINALAIPPAYESVWICPSPLGHLQATGRDARGRKQYRYHAAWTAVRDADKYQNLLSFGLALPRIRRQVARDMKTPGLTQDKVIAVLVRLLEITLIRIGAREYARANKSYGLTTLKRRHTTVAGSRFRFQFQGKSGVPHDVTVTDRRVARVIRRCLDIPGQQLFQYLDEDGGKHPVDSGGVNAYLRAAGGGDFTAKHYRTWAGSVLAYAALQSRPPEDERKARQDAADVIKQVARRLANTPAVCRACYVHPAILDAYLAGTLPPRAAAPDGPRGLNADERRLLAFLRSQAAPAARSEN
ncbi:DNA topoisomerase IB [Achromobacter deleyi]|uniref:DNA topoisomerase IB n=1 Tax=Achromobacter deleyi TaxID=1353891 RepID=UPI00149292DD|nr:DNA topoisomerase IB [Achromobacter deleyi]QVQ28116.1 DNA topoisomerase IB [Achromobacter deleyi]UIP18304.1 DNA topoisomerase IB [Achromobacter deleyi]